MNKNMNGPATAPTKVDLSWDFIISSMTHVKVSRDGLTTSSPAAKRAESAVERACERNVANGAFGGRVQRLVLLLVGLLCLLRWF
jgi:hypothetical protein